MKKIITTVLLLFCILLKAQTVPESLLTNKLIKPNDPILEKWLNSHPARTLALIQQTIISQKKTETTNLTNKLSSDKFNVANSKLKRKIKQEQLALLETNFTEDLKTKEEYYNELPEKIKAYIESSESYKIEIAEQERVVLEKKRTEERKIEKRNLIKRDSINQVEYEIKVKKSNDEWNAIPKSSDYITWKAKYQNYIKSAKVNIAICESIRKKHSYKNLWGQRLVDVAAFPKADKVIYNKNRNAIQSKINAINDLIYSNNTFNNYYNTFSTNEQSIELYKLQQYLNENSESY